MSPGTVVPSVVTVTAVEGITAVVVITAVEGRTSDNAGVCVATDEVVWNALVSDLQE